VNRVKRTAQTVAALAAVTTAAVGCGPVTAAKSVAQHTADLSPAALLKVVGEKTTAAKSAKVEAETKIAGSDMTMKGAISWANGLTGNLTVDTSGGSAGQAVSKVGAGQMQIRYLPDAMYINMGSQMASMLQGKHWMSYKYDDLAKLAGGSGSALKDSLKNADPMAQVRSLIASGKVQKIGEETVDGVATTHYAGDVSAADITATNGLSAADVAAVKQQMQTAGISTEHIELWINADHLPAKETVSANTNAGSFTMTAKYSDYGVPVSVQPPAASDTFDASQMMSKAKLRGTS
jgi:hypothetical protein